MHIDLFKIHAQYCTLIYVCVSIKIEERSHSASKTLYWGLLWSCVLLNQMPLTVTITLSLYYNVIVTVNGIWLTFKDNIQTISVIFVTSDLLKYILFVSILQCPIPQNFAPFFWRTLVLGELHNYSRANWTRSPNTPTIVLLERKSKRKREKKITKMQSRNVSTKFLRRRIK